MSQPQENSEAAQEVLHLLSMDKLQFLGTLDALPPELQSRVIVVNGLDNLGPHLQSDVGYFALEAVLEELQSQAYGVAYSNNSLMAELKDLEREIMSFSWTDVVGNDTDDVGDDIEAQLVAFVAVRLAFGKSNPFVEDCLQIFHSGLWPFGWDHKAQKYLAFCAGTNS